MKTSTNLLQAETNNHEESSKKVRTGKVLRYLLFIFMFLQIFVLYSCAVGYRTPRHHRDEIIIEGNDHGGHHDRGDHHDNDDHR